MENEIESATNLILHIMELSKTSIPHDQLQKLRSHIINDTTNSRYWPDPNYFEFDINHYQVDYRLRLYFGDESGIDHELLKSSFPEFLRIYGQPKSVRFQIGEIGPLCYLYNEHSPPGPWLPSDEYRLQAKALMKPGSINAAECTFMYLKYKNHYSPWNGRKVKLERLHFTIDGEEWSDDEENEYWDEMRTPEVIKSNESNFDSFCSKLRKGTDNYHLTKRECAEEWINQFNCEEASELYKTHENYLRKYSPVHSNNSPTGDPNTEQETEPESPPIDFDRLICILENIPNKVPYTSKYYS